MSKLSISDDVRELRQELSLIKELIKPQGSATTSGLRLSVHVERIAGDRKPFYLVFYGGVEKRIRMSATRTAITLTLLLDIDQRTRGFPGLLNTRELALEVLKIMNSNKGDSFREQEQIRVGFYRFSAFWKEELAETVPAFYDPDQERLVPLESGGSCGVEIYSSDPAIEDALPKLGRPAMLDRLSRDRFLYVPAGGAGSDRFLSEVYRVSSPLTVALTYARPQLITVPASILEKYVESSDTRTRNATMLTRLSEGSLSFTEIVPEDSIARMTSGVLEGTRSYFPGMERSDVVEHLKNIERLVLASSGYKLVLTRCEIPFYIGTYNSEVFKMAVFYRLPQSDQQSSFSSLAVWGGELPQMTEATIFQWLLNHPTTNSDPEAVAKIIRAAYTSLLG